MSKIMKVPNYYINRTLNVMKSAIIFYYNRFELNDSEVTNKHLNYIGENVNPEKHILINTDSDNIILGTIISCDLNDFDYPLHSKRPNITNSNIVNVRIEICFSNKNESTFNVTNDSNENYLVRMRFNIYSIVQNIKNMTNMNYNIFNSMFHYLKHSIRHEWMHFIQCFILHYDQMAVKAFYSDHSDEYYTSYAERLPMLESARGLFETVICNNEFWNDLSKNDKMKFVRQFVGIDRYDYIHITIGKETLTLKTDLIHNPSIFAAYKRSKPQTYNLIVKKFIGMISPRL
ncbi:hypothetical protein PBI_SCTP2_23 [Salicola phage SCTP-2]|nr:hypothetical protein PBI_SCTP2_23 [Salicola phage SCTP-2]